MFAVKKLNRNGRWDIVSLVDEKGSFRGLAVFESKNEAQKYLEEYMKRMDRRSMVCSRRGTKSPQELKVFTIDNDNQQVLKRKGPNPKKVAG
jgi:hypothetical protein